MPKQLSWQPLRAGQLLIRLQLPFVTGLLFLGLGVAITAPLQPVALLLGGLVLAALAPCLFLVRAVDWSVSSWAVLVPIMDIVAIAGVRTALLPFLPTVGMLCLFPFAWIAYRFRWPGLLIVFAGGIFITALPFVVGAAPAITTGLALLNLAALPLLATGIAVAILNRPDFRSVLQARMEHDEQEVFAGDA